MRPGPAQSPPFRIRRTRPRPGRSMNSIARRRSHQEGVPPGMSRGAADHAVCRQRCRPEWSGIHRVQNQTAGGHRWGFRTGASMPRTQGRRRRGPSTTSGSATRSSARQLADSAGRVLLAAAARPARPRAVGAEGRGRRCRSQQHLAGRARAAAADGLGAQRGGGGRRDASRRPIASGSSTRSTAPASSPRSRARTGPCTSRSGSGRPRRRRRRPPGHGRHLGDR